jgi:hypothetical protein
LNEEEMFLMMKTKEAAFSRKRFIHRYIFENELLPLKWLFFKLQYKKRKTNTTPRI